MDSSQNPPLNPDENLATDLPASEPAPINASSNLATNPPAETLPPSGNDISAENPVWSGWDVLGIVLVMFFTFLIFPMAVYLVAHKLWYPDLAPSAMLQKPILALFSQCLAYVALFFYMVILVEGKYHRRFSEALSWHWPQRWPAFLGMGVGLVLVLNIGLSHFLPPIPKNMPFDQFFKHAEEAYLTSIFAVSFGPLMEELLFRGFLYPVLARRLGKFLAILLTSLGFGAMHASQYAFSLTSWTAVFLIFLVGVALTVVRAMTRSLASSFLVHVGYNLTVTSLLFLGTDGFRHLERMSQ